MIDLEGSSIGPSAIFPGATEVFLTEMKLEGSKRYNGNAQLLL